MTAAHRLWALMMVAVLCAAAFMLMGAQGQWSFILPFRGTKLAAMIVVACAVALSSVLFQTITHNRILTPAIMGFDALYVLLQALIIFIGGLDPLAAGHPIARFFLETALMTGFACILFQWVFSGAEHSLHRVVLVGIVFGLLFRSLSSFMIRLIDPNEFLVLQDRMFASFNSIQSDLLVIALPVAALACGVGWHLRRSYDVLALGRDTAINLGIPYRRVLMLTLVLIALLVSISTALTGPVMFFGLLASNLAYMVMQSDRHRHTVPAAMLLAVILLVGGQTILERVLHLNATVSVVIEFAGGLMFIALVAGRRKA